MRFYFKCFSTEYAHALKAKSLQQAMISKRLLKMHVFSQCTKYPRIRGKGPWKLDITYFTPRRYPVSNYGEITHYIIEALSFKSIIPDNALGIIEEINIKVRPLMEGQQEGAILLFTPTEAYKPKEPKDYYE